MSIKVERAEAPLAQFYMEKQPWVNDAACLGMHPDIFFDAIEHADAEVKVECLELAEATCLACGVRKQCLDQAMREEGSAASGRHGYRGGTTPQDRRNLYRNPV